MLWTHIKYLIMLFSLIFTIASASQVLVSSFQGQGKRGSERLSDFSKDTQLMSAEAGI